LPDTRGEGDWGGREVFQTMSTFVSKCKNDKIKENKYIKQ
jgi:hypothetical protein